MTMTREEVMADARTAGLVVEPCRHEDFIAIRLSEIPEDRKNERMRMTAEGALLTVADGYYWQVGTIEDVANYLKTKK